MVLSMQPKDSNKYKIHKYKDSNDKLFTVILKKCGYCGSNNSDMMIIYSSPEETCTSQSRPDFMLMVTWQDYGKVDNSVWNV